MGQCLSAQGAQRQEQVAKVKYSAGVVKVGEAEPQTEVKDLFALDSTSNTVVDTTTEGNSVAANSQARPSKAGEAQSGGEASLHKSLQQPEVQKPSTEEQRQAGGQEQAPIVPPVTVAVAHRVSTQQANGVPSSSSLAQLSACVRMPTQPADGEIASKEQATPADSDTEEIVCYQGGCCGPVARKEMNLSKLSFDMEALEKGLAGLPHDVIQHGAPRPANEDGRMATVRALRNMQITECPELDLICKVVCRIWNAPAACITLLDSDHVFICSSQGMTAAHRPWAVAMCPWMLLAPCPTSMAIDDLTSDARFSKSAHVVGGTRSYLTSPLVASNGHRLGAICFTDTKPRRFDAGDCRMMNNFAELAIRALESHLEVSRRLGIPTPKLRLANSGQHNSQRQRSGSGAANTSGGPHGSGEPHGRASASGGMGRGPLLDTDDGDLMEEFRNRVRDLAEVDESVVLLVDTRSPGWTVLYTSTGFEALTGVAREAAMGASLNEVMAHVSGDSRVVWEGVEREAAAGKAFVTPRVYCKGSPATTFYLSFRPAATDDMDDQTVTMGVPANVPQAASATTSRLFFARLHTTPDPPANSRMHSHATSAILTTGRRLPPAIAINPVHGLTDLYQDLVVGQVLGQGSYGTVYHGRWHGVDVAIKVQDMHIRSAEERVRAEFEVGLGQRLHHLNVVHTLAHASALLERSPNSELMESGSNNGWNAGLPLYPLGMMMATATGLSSGNAGDNSGEEGGYGGGPAFIPFFANANDGAVAMLGAAAAAADRADGDGGDVTLVASSTGHSSPAAPGGADRSSPTPPSVPAATLRAYASGAGRDALPIVSGSLFQPVVRVALPSGAQVPMLRHAGTSGVPSASGRPLPAVSANCAGLNPAGMSLAALMATRGSSMGQNSGSNMSTAGTAAAAAAAAAISRGQASIAAAAAGPPPAPTTAMMDAAAAALVAAQTAAPEPSSLQQHQTNRAPSSRLGGNMLDTMSEEAASCNDDRDDCGVEDAGMSPFVVDTPVDTALTNVQSSTVHGSGGTSGSPWQPPLVTAGCGLGPDGSHCRRDGKAFGSSIGVDNSHSSSALTHRPVWQQVGTTGTVLEPAGPSGLMEAGMSTLEEEASLDGGMAGDSGSGALSKAGGGGGGGGGIGNVSGPIEADLSGLSYPLDVRLWMLLEFMDKGSLQDAIDRGWLREGRTADQGPDYPAVLATLGEVASSLSYIHSHDVVHGDLSAVNVLLQSVRQQGDDSRPGGEAASDHSCRGFISKICDFGLSMQLAGPNQAIKTAAYGTITHMAPEVLRDSALSKPGDVYSIGVLLWQMVTGSRPWAGLSHLQVSVEVGQNRRSLQWPAWVHGGVRALGQRMMAPQPEQRPSAAQVQAELGVLVQQMPQYA